MPTPVSQRTEATERIVRRRNQRRRRRRRLAVTLSVVAVLVVGIVVLIATARHAGTSPDGNPRSAGAISTSMTRATAPPDATSPPFTVASVTLPLVDTTRTQTVDGTTGPRQLPTTVWYPSNAAGERPLVVFATGYLQCVAQYGPMLEAWAAAGFVVAAPTFPLTNCAVPGGANENDEINQPADVSFVTRQLLAVSATGRPGQSQLRGRIDPKEIVLAGQSDGGNTVAAVAFDSSYSGIPVRAAVILSGELLPSFGGTWFPPSSPPMLIVQGTADTVNLPAESQQLYNTDTSGPKAMVMLDGADHLGPYEGSNPTEQLVVQVTLDFLDQYVLREPGAAAALVRDGNRPGVDSLVDSPGP